MNQPKRYHTTLRPWPQEQIATTWPAASDVGRSSVLNIAQHNKLHLPFRLGSSWSRRHAPQKGQDHCQFLAECHAAPPGLEPGSSV